MSLEDIRKKESTIATPSAQELAGAPEVWENKFKFHVNTYIAVADVEDRWNAILNNLLNNRSSTGLIYADKGYGKTSTGASLWQSAESKEIVAVPPFAWNSLSDMLTATHGWIRYRLQDTLPELISGLEQKHRAVVEVDEETLIQRMVNDDGLSYGEGRKVIARLKEEGRLLDMLSPYQLLDYLRFATEMLLKSGYKGLLILPDEFELFKSNPDTAQNYQHLKDFIFGLYGEENLPIGCVAFTYNRTFADIELRAGQILDRFNKPEGSLINLEQFYGQTEFAKHLWTKLSVTCKLSPLEREAIDEDVLNALGQFLRHARSRELITGPRSVVRTFNCAAHHYKEKKVPYSLFDFCDDLLSGSISYGTKESETVATRNQMTELPVIQNNTEGQKLIKLLCVHPEGVPNGLFQKYNIPDSVRETVIQTLLGQHVITKVTGPTLTSYRDDLLGIDELNEILKMLRTSFNSTDREFHRGAVRAFNRHVFPAIFPKKTGASLGWVNRQEIEESGELHCRKDLRGTVLNEYPERTLTVNIGTEIMSAFSSPESQFHTQFILDTTGNTGNTLEIKANGLNFHFNIQRPIDAQKIPDDIGKLGELFLPESITPLLLLSILDFFDKESIISMVEAAKQDAEVNFLKEQVLSELIRYLFSPKIKAEAVFDPPEFSTDFASVPAGRNFVEYALRILIPKQFPDYSAISTAAQWKRYLDVYSNALNKASNLGVKRGSEPIRTVNSSVPELFSSSGVNAFRNFYNVVGRELLRIEDNSGTQIDVDSRNIPVVVYFTLHRFEKHLVEQLQTSPHSIPVDGKYANIIESREVYQHARGLGYLDDEIDTLIAILGARGMVDKRNVSGLEYLYLVEQFLDFTELKAKLQGLEEDIALAESKDFAYECDNLSSAKVLVATPGIEDDEVLKDTLRQKLNSAEAQLKHQRDEWLMTEYDQLKQKIQRLETLDKVHIRVPSVLDQATGHPLTDFSPILFQSVRLKVRSAYTKISDEIQKIQAEVRETRDKEIHAYKSELSPQNAIETACRLRENSSQVDVDIERLSEAANEARELSDLFDYWRVLASQIEGNKQLMMDSPADAEVQNLIDRLDAVERDIRQHLSESRLNLKDVLSSSEHFKTQVETIKTEFDQKLAGKKDSFISYQSQILDQLKTLPGLPPNIIDFNPVRSDGCYRGVRENAIAKLRSVIDDVLSENNSRQRELLKPIKVFNIPESIKTKAVLLQKDLENLAEEFGRIHLGFKAEDVNQNRLSEWVDEINSKLEEGRTISERRKQLERELDEFVPKPSPKAKRLRDELALQQETDFTELIIRLLGDETFSSTVEILEGLEELYQANLVNLTVHRK